MRPIVRRTLKLAATLGAITLLTATPALAHVEIASSNPADGAIVTETPAAISLEFSVDADLAGEGVVLTNANGIEVPATVLQTAPTIVLIEPIEMLANGAYIVAWTMKAGDAHPATGTVTFEIDNPIGTSGPTDGTDAVIETDSTSEPGAGTDAATEIGRSRQSGSPTAGEWTARIGRWIAMVGGLVAIGSFAFAATSLVGTRQEVARAGFWVRRSGILVVFGTAIEALGASMVTAALLSTGFGGGAIAETITGPYGVALLLRVVGGLAMLHGTGIIASASHEPILSTSNAPAVVTSNHQRPGTVATMTSTPATSYRLDVHREGFALAGIAMVVASFLFDGHTVIATPALVVRVANVAHVTAAGIWIGGVLLMAHTLTARHREGRSLGASQMAIRFSVVASIALATVGIAGGILTIAILDSPLELISTPWGRLLILKTLGVAAAASIGAFNHYRVVPTLEEDPADNRAAEQLRQLVRREGAILIGVVAVTAALVGAAS